MTPANDADRVSAPVPVSPPTSHAHSLFRWGLFASVAYAGGLGIYAWVERGHMLQMKPHDFATFLSGVFAPLAFLWLVLGFRQQGDELQNSARALWLQGEELRNSVEQQRQLVEVTREQLAAEHEQRMREEEEAERAAQPQLLLELGGYMTGPGYTQNFRLVSAGPTCSELVVSVWGDNVEQTAVMGPRSDLVWQMNFMTPEQVQPATFSVDYTDARGQRREQKFFADVAQMGPVERVFTAPQRLGFAGKIATRTDETA